MTPDQVIATICSTFSGVVAKPSWGETAMFYNPGSALYPTAFILALFGQIVDVGLGERLQR
jgi:hypothetical protein